MQISVCIPVKGDPFIARPQFRKVKIKQDFQAVTYEPAGSSSVIYMVSSGKCGGDNDAAVITAGVSTNVCEMKLAGLKACRTILAKGFTVRQNSSDSAFLSRSQT
jgi:hypothetical protein